MLNKNLIVKDVMLSLNQIPLAKNETILKETLEIMGKFKLGIVCIVGEHNELSGIITDGDLRRMLLSVQKPFSALLNDDSGEYAIKYPTTVNADVKLVDALGLMEKKQVWDLPVISDSGVLIGLLHMHSALRKILFT